MIVNVYPHFLCPFASCLAKSADAQLIRRTRTTEAQRPPHKPGPYTSPLWKALYICTASVAPDPMILGRDLRNGACRIDQCSSLTHDTSDSKDHTGQGFPE